MALSGSHNTGSYDGRYYTFSWTATQSTSGNYSTVSWTISCSGGNSSWYAERTLNLTINGTTVYSKTSRVQRYTGTIKTGSLTISHNSDGSKSFAYAMNVAVYTSSVNCTCSGTDTLTTIPRQSSITSASAVTMGNACSITWTPYVSTYKFRLNFSCGGNSVTYPSSSYISPGSTSSYTYTGYTFAIATWAPYITSKTSATCTVTLYTYNSSGTSIGSDSDTFTLSVPSSVVPTIDSISLSDPNGYYSTYSAFVQNYSKLYFSISASGLYGASISSYSVTVNSQSFTASTGTTNLLTSSGSKTISVTVKDSRGRSTTSSSTYTVLAYSSPVISSASVWRCDEDGEELITGEYGAVTFSGSISSLNSQNSVTWYVKYKKSSASSYTSVTASSTSTVSSLVKTFAADSDSSYDVQVIGTDEISTTTWSASLSTAFALMHFNSSGDALAIGKLSETEGAFELGMPLVAPSMTLAGIPIKFDYGSLSIAPTAANTPTSATVSFNIDFDTIIGVFTTAISSVPGTQMLGTSVSSVTTTGCTIWLTRTNTTETGIRWLAIGY